MVTGVCPNVKIFVIFMNIIHTYINRQSYIDLHSPQGLRDGDHYDFIVVGAGSAGCVVANRLSEIAKWKVLLLEAGGEEPLEMSVPAFRSYAIDTRLDWQYQTQAQPGFCAGKPCAWNRGKVLGGTSVINWMVYSRGNRRDYDNWEQQGNTGWGFEDVLPFFKKSENNLDPDIANNTEYHGTGSYLSLQKFSYVDKNTKIILDAYDSIELGQHDFNAQIQTGMMLTQGTLQDGERRSTNRAFVEPIRNVRSNFKVVTNVRVTKVLIHSENKTAHGIEFSGENDRKFKGKIFVDKEVIISGGTINSPQILQLSGIGPKKVLEKAGIKVIHELDVGQNLQDHVGANGFTIKLDRFETKLSAKDELENSMKKYLLSSSGPLSTVQTASAIGFVKSKYAPQDEDFPDIEIAYYGSVTPPEDQSCNTDVTIPTEYFDRLTFVASVLRPESVGNITINSSDPFEHPLIYPNYLDSTHDINIIIEGFNFGTKVLETDVMKNAGYKLNRTQVELCKDYEFGTDDYWICLARNHTRAMFHPTGTCKMGPSSDASAVVDPELRVHGINGLRVADCSIMPTIISGNVNAAAIMIGERCADFIKKSWKASTRQNIQRNGKQLQMSLAVKSKVMSLYGELRRTP